MSIRGILRDLVVPCRNLFDRPVQSLLRFSRAFTHLINPANHFVAYVISIVEFTSLTINFGSKGLEFPLDFLALRT